MLYIFALFCIQVHSSLFKLYRLQLLICGGFCFYLDPPGKPEPMDVTKSTVSLVWGRPKHDGGSKLIGYYVEYTKLPEEKWTRCNANCMNIQTENYVVTNLQEGQQYQFRIIAKTAINSSLPSELSDPIPVIAENGTTLHSNESDTQIQSYTNNHEGFFPLLCSCSSCGIRC